MTSNRKFPLKGDDRSDDVSDDLSDDVSDDTSDDVSDDTSDDVSDDLSGDDDLTGTSGTDDLDGGRGNDRLSGGDGDDVLRAGFGNDDLSGGRGSDVFGFYALGHFVVRDFKPNEDRLFFDAAKTGIDDLDELKQSITGFEQTTDGAVVHFGSEASITLVGINLNDLTGDMILFNLGA